LVNSTKLECRTTLASHNLDCSFYDKRIEEKINYANIYLTAQLTQLYIGDSSNLYQNKIKELEKLENQKPKNASDSLIILNEKERLYLLTSLLFPERSYSNFINLIKCYFELPTKVLISENSISYYAFKNYLYKLLQERFPDEIRLFRNQATLKYNRVGYLSELEFNDIENESKLLDEIDRLLKEVVTNNYIEKNYNDLIVQIYNIRALKVTQKFKIVPSDSLNNFIESLYSKALLINPDEYHTNYNFGAFYYNQALDIVNSSQDNLSDEEMKNKLIKITELYYKAQPYLDKSKLQDKH
jgi:hypothetical protein